MERERVVRGGGGGGAGAAGAAGRHGVGAGLGPAGRGPAIDAGG